MENDLRHPLKRRSLPARWLSARPSALRATSLACIALLGGVAGWLVLSHEPYGGEPVVHMRLDMSDPVITSSVTPPARPQPDADPDSAEMSADNGADTPLIDLSELGSRQQSETENDLDRRRRELAGRATASANVESPAGALSVDDLAHSRNEQAFIPSRASMALVPAPVAKELGKRGLIYVDDGSKGLSRATQLAGILGLDARSAVVDLDGDGSPASILAALQKLEALARHSGMAIATGPGLPATIEAVEQWTQGLAGRNILLVPVSAAFAARRS